jgi:hypothetical protein
VTRRRWIAAALALWAGCAAVYFLTAPGRIDMVDGTIRYETTDSLLTHGRLDILNSYTPGTAGRGGRHFSYYPIGTPLLSLPFVAAGSWLGHGNLESKQFAFSLTSVPFAAATIAVLFLIFGRLGCTLPSAARWALVVAFCTPLWVYAGSSFDIAQQTLFITVGVWAAVEALAVDSLAWAIASGLSFALLVNVQETYVVLAACIADVVPVSARTIRSRLTSRVVLTIGALIAIGLGGVLAYNAYKFGNPFDTGRGTVPHPLVGNPAVGLAGLFFSPAKSILLYCPPYIAALLGLRRLLQRDRARYAPVAACLVIHIAMVATLKFWAGEWAWGPRYLIASLPLACIGLPFAAVSTRQSRLVAGLCALGLGVQLLAISVDHQRYYFARSYYPFFWVNESTMYRDSPLLSRPRELVEVLSGRDLDKVRYYVPSERLFSMTSSSYGPPLAARQNVPAWMRQFLVFVVPRPWTIWSFYLPPSQRPGRTDVMTVAGLLAALASFTLLWWIVRPERSSAGATLKDEQMVEA